MEFKRVKLIVGLVSAGLLCLIGIQVFWAFSSYRMSEKNIASRSLAPALLYSSVWVLFLTKPK